MKTKDGKYVARMVWGRDSINALEEATTKNIAQVASECDLTERVFDTEAELNAYYMGMADTEGWENFQDGEDFPDIPDKVWEQFRNTEG